jgi:MSHA pilin protein MshC
MVFEESIGAVRYAQKLALASGCLTQVSLGSGGYQVRQAAGCTGGAYTLAVIGADGQSPYANTLPGGVTVNPTSFPVVFDSLGRPSSAASATIGGFILNVAAETGLVQ